MDLIFPRPKENTMPIWRSSAPKWISALFHFCLWLQWLAMLEKAEAIHPDCALVVQLVKAKENCIWARRQEARNRTSASGIIFTQ
ncbi:unnamed protein product [Arctogadus glacialis]